MFIINIIQQNEKEHVEIPLYIYIKKYIRDTKLSLILKLQKYISLRITSVDILYF